MRRMKSLSNMLNPPEANDGEDKKKLSNEMKSRYLQVSKDEIEMLLNTVSEELKSIDHRSDHSKLTTPSRFDSNQAFGSNSFPKHIDFDTKPLKSIASPNKNKIRARSKKETERAFNIKIFDI